MFSELQAADPENAYVLDILEKSAAFDEAASKFSLTAEA